MTHSYLNFCSSTTHYHLLHEPKPKWQALSGAMKMPFILQGDLRERAHLHSLWTLGFIHRVSVWPQSQASLFRLPGRATALGSRTSPLFLVKTGCFWGYLLAGGEYKEGGKLQRGRKLTWRNPNGEPSLETRSLKLESILTGSKIPTQLSAAQHLWLA